MIYNIKYSIGGATVPTTVPTTVPATVQATVQATMQATMPYKDEYDPQIFLDILKENNIQVTDHSDKIKDFPDTAVHTSFKEVKELIKVSCNRFISEVNREYETIMLIPMFIEQAGVSLGKSNFWFSLLYLDILINELKFSIKDVIFINPMSAPAYFSNLTDKNISFNAILCDDGSYSGAQLNNTITRILLKENKSHILNHINTFHFCFPFCVSRCKELSKKNIEKRDEIKEHILRLTYEIYGKKPYNYSHMIKATKEAKDQVKKLHTDISPAMFDLLTDSGLNSSKKYFGDFIKFHVGDENFNKLKNHWFDHKIPDDYSFVPPYRPTSDMGYSIKSPYKKTWYVIGQEITNDHKESLTTYRNANKILINRDYKETTTINEEEYPKDTSRIGSYFKYFDDLENKYIESLGI